MANTKTTANAAQEVITVEYETPKGTNLVDVIMWYQDNYLVGAPTIDGELHKELMVGGVTKEDVEAGIKAELKAIEMADGDIWAGMNNLRDAMATTLEGIRPTEQIEVEGYSLMVDYNTRKAYTLSRVEVANLDDLSEEVTSVLPNAAVKAMLIDRAKVWVAEKMEEEREAERAYMDGEYDEDRCSYCDEPNCDCCPWD